MKKLVMAMAIALAAVAAQAEEVHIMLYDVYRAGTEDEISANGYLIYSDTLPQSDALIAAFYSAGASYESTIASSAALPWGIDEGYHFDFAEVSSLGAMYALCFDQDNNNNYMYVSPVANAKWDESGDPAMYRYKINAGDTSSAAAMSASGGWQGAGWYSVASPSPIPEPTSGLLMLLGVAGLALKRKRA